MQAEIEKLFDEKPQTYTDHHFHLFERFKQALNAGQIRAAEPDNSTNTGWRVNTWVKKGILIGFRMGTVVDMSINSTRQPWFDKATFPVQHITADRGIRIVPGGSSIGDGSMIDSHALVGSCAQVGSNCHISAAAQIGGVLEPVGALPVIIEDEVLMGGNCGVYEGTVLKRRAVLGSGVILNRSTPVYDVARGQIHRATDDDPLVIPEDAVVVAGSRAITSGRGREWGLSLYTPVIVKYRDSKTDTKIQLEHLLR